MIVCAFNSFVVILWFQDLRWTDIKLNKLTYIDF